MKKILFFAATAMLFAACSSDEVNAPEVTKDAPQAVAFDTYTASATRAGQTGVMTTTTLQTTGFGVFAQQSDGYTASLGPNFMYNQEVTYSSSAWTYSPLKYWPNETGTDSQSPAATSTDVEYLSFFAYAPYVGTPAGPDGIVGLSANTATSDPLVRYTVSTTPSSSVDLLWGVAPSGGLSYTDVTGGNTTVAEGMPLLDLLKPSKDQKIKFLFKHALARIGMTVVAAYDQIAAGGTGSATTKIAVKSVKVEETTATKALGTYGSLILNNTSPNQAYWVVLTQGFSATINDANELNPDLKYDTNASTTYSQTGTWTGVTTSETNVINNNKYFMVIPTHANTDLDVTIDYVVITKDANVNGGYVETENIITKKVTIPTLTNNKAYNLKLILGMTSVKLDAEVADWEVDGSVDVNLPRNNE